MIKIDALNYRYKRKPPLFRDLDLEIPSGNIYGLLGKNGAGKTTLLKLISGMLAPESGSCSVFGYDPGQRLPSMLKDVVIVPEEFYLPPLKIREYIAINAGFYPSFDHGQMQTLLQNYQLDQDDKLHQLSYGQKKKFIIGFGLASNAKLLLLDEPTNGLDIPSKSQFRKILASSITEDRIFIISTHQARDLENLIDPIIIVDEGKIIFNYDTGRISEKLGFETVKDREDAAVLYAEETLGGYNAIVKSNNEPTRVDVELLFNGVLNNTRQIKDTLNN